MAAEVLAFGTPIGHPVSLAAAIGIAVDRLRREDPAAAQLLRLSAALAPEPIPVDLFTTVPVGALPTPLAAVAGSTVALHRSVGRLGRYGLARVGAGGLQLHRLTKAIRPGTMDHMNEAAPTLFLMVGLPGSGKTVRARELAAERGALRLTADDWALSLFGQEDRHQGRPDGKRWLLEGRLVALAIDALRLRLSVVLDFGLWSRDERSALRWLAASVGASCEIVYLPVEREVQWSRIQSRWKHTPEQTFPMAEAELDPWRDAFEVPDADELSGSFLPSLAPGDESWFDWAQRFWPSLAESLNGRLPER